MPIPGMAMQISHSSILSSFLAVCDVDIQVCMEWNAYNDKVSTTSVQEYKLYHEGHMFFPSFVMNHYLKEKKIFSE